MRSSLLPGSAVGQDPVAASVTKPKEPAGELLLSSHHWQQCQRGRGTAWTEVKLVLIIYLRGDQDAKKTFGELSG